MAADEKFEILARDFAALDLPTYSDEEVAKLANDCRAAMKGFGTDETRLIKIIAPLNAKQAKQLVSGYHEHLKRDLIADIKDECGGKFEDALVALLTPPELLIAQEVRDAAKALNTDEKKLIQFLCGLSDVDLEAVKNQYHAKFQSYMPEDVVKATGGKFKKLFEAMLLQPRKTPEDSQVQSDVEALYKAGEDKWGTDEATFIKILAGYSPGYVAKVSQAYGVKYGRPLEAVIRKEMSGDLEDALVALVIPFHEQLSRRLLKAMKGVGTDESALIRDIVIYRDGPLTPACAHFMKENQKSVAKWVEDEVGGDFKKTLLAVLTKATSQ